MSVKFVRIDDRLLHGQVVTTWLKRHESRRTRRAR